MPKPAPMYPGAVATDGQLTIAQNRLLTKLATPITALDTQMTVQDASRIESFSLLSLDKDGEIVKVLAPPAGNVVNIQRAFDGTPAAAHLAGATVSGFVDAWHHNVLASEVQAIQQTLGPNLANIGTTLAFNPGLYDFIPMSPGGTLGPGLNVITLSPVPRGVNGSNTKHYLYISGGTGAAEAVLIQGGTAVSGAASGTVIVNCTTSHSGAWTIRSATAGIQEAEKSLPASGGIVAIGPGNFTIYAPISYQQNRTIQGSGCATRLVPATSSLVVLDSNLPVHPQSAYDVHTDNIRFVDFVIDGHTMATNTLTGVRHLAQATTELYSIVGVRFDRVHFNNIRYAVHMQRVLDIQFFGVWSYANSQLLFDDMTPMETAYHNYEITFDQFNYQWRTMDGDVAHPTLQGVGAVTIVAGEVVYFVNSLWSMSGGNTGMDGLQLVAGSEGLAICNCHMINARYGIWMTGMQYGNGQWFYPGFVTIANFGVDQLWGAAIFAEDGKSSGLWENVHDVLLVNCMFTNPHPSSPSLTMVHIGKFCRRWQISNTQFAEFSNAFPQTGLYVGANSSLTMLRDLQFINDIGDGGGIGLQIDATAGVFGVDSCCFDGLTNGLLDNGNSAASAAALTLPQGRSAVRVTGSVTITSISAPVGPAIHRVTLTFQNAVTVTNGGNLRLAGNMVATPNSTLSLQWNAGVWYELSRSVAA